MKMVEAIIRVSAFEAVHDALDRWGIEGLTVSEVLGAGHEPGRTQRYRGTAYEVDTCPRLRLELVASDAAAGPIADAIARAARTGRVGDGLVSILDVEDVVRIRTGQRGSAAVSNAIGSTEGEDSRALPSAAFGAARR